MKNIVFAVETIYNGENKGIKALYSKEEKARAYAERLNINFVKEPSENDEYKYIVFPYVIEDYKEE